MCVRVPHQIAASGTFFSKHCRILAGLSLPASASTEAGGVVVWNGAEWGGGYRVAEIISKFRSISAVSGRETC